MASAEAQTAEAPKVNITYVAIDIPSEKELKILLEVEEQVN